MEKCHLKKLTSTSLYSTSGTVEFSLANRVGKKEFEEVTTSSTCKSWMQDAICGSIIGKNSAQHNVSLYPKAKLGKLAICIYYGNIEHRRNADTALLLLRPVEKRRRLLRSKVFKVETSGKASVVFLLSQRWFHNPIMMSLATTLIRVAAGLDKSIAKELSMMPAEKFFEVLLQRIDLGKVTCVHYNDSCILETFVKQGGHRTLMSRNHNTLFAKEPKDNFTASHPAVLHNPGIQSWSAWQGNRCLYSSPPWTKWAYIGPKQEEKS